MDRYLKQHKQVADQQTANERAGKSSQEAKKGEKRKKKEGPRNSPEVAMQKHTA
jgi:hypothetical protein